MFSVFDVVPEGPEGGRRALPVGRINPDDLNALSRAQATALETGRAPAVELRLVHRDGSEHIVRGEAVTETDKAGSVVALAGYFRDVTDQRKAEALLESAAAQWSGTFDAMPDAIALVGPDGRMVRANFAAVALSGRPMSDVVGHSCDEVFHRPGYAGCVYRRALETTQVEENVMERGGRWVTRHLYTATGRRRPGAGGHPGHHRYHQIAGGR